MTDAQRIGYVTSRDGTRIGFLRQGTGPGLVLVQGAMADARAYAELATCLAPFHTVYSLDRRGRGLSPKPYDPSHDIGRDVEDIDAVLAETGVSNVFGLSSGGVIALEAARTLERVTKVAVYEPPFYADGISRAGVERLNAAIKRGDLGAALVDSLVTAGTAPASLRALPRAVSTLIGRIVIRVDSRKHSDDARLAELVPGVRYDFNAVAGMDGRMPTFATMSKPVLLLTGTKSPAFLRQSSQALKRTLPDAQLRDVPGLGHDGPWNRSRGGAPSVVAAPLLEFFT